MDFDFGTLLYIAFGIIYFIYSGVKKNQKKAQKPISHENPETVGPPPVKRQPTFEELLEEFTGKKPEDLETVPEPVYEPEPVVQEVFKPEPVKKREPILEFQKEEKKSAPLVAFKEYEGEEVETEDYAANFSNLDDAKKAFIASEIFKTKY